MEWYRPTRHYHNNGTIDVNLTFEGCLLMLQELLSRVYRVFHIETVRNSPFYMNMSNLVMVLICCLAATDFAVVGFMGDLPMLESWRDSFAMPKCPTGENCAKAKRTICPPLLCLWRHPYLKLVRDQSGRVFVIHRLPNLRIVMLVFAFRFHLWSFFLDLVINRTTYRKWPYGMKSYWWIWTFHRIFLSASSKIIVAWTFLYISYMHTTITPKCILIKYMNSDELSATEFHQIYCIIIQTSKQSFLAIFTRITKKSPRFSLFHPQVVV